MSSIVKNFSIVERNDGFLCMKVSKDNTISELQNICSVIIKGLESGSIIAMVEWAANDLFTIFDITILDDSDEKIGTVEFMHCDMEDEDEDFYDFILEFTNPINKEYSQEEWDELSDTVVEELISILN